MRRSNANSAIGSCNNCRQKFRLQQKDASADGDRLFCGLDCRSTDFLRPMVPLNLNQPFDNMQKEKDRFKDQINAADGIRLQQQQMQKQQMQQQQMQQ